MTDTPLRVKTSSRLLQHSSCHHSASDTMSCNIVALCLFFISGSLADLSDFVHLEYDAGDIVKPKPPLLAQRDGRFIRFDAGETEIELEMGVSVPFLKIPINGKSGVEHHTHDNRITINPAGLLVGATLLATTFLLVPLAFPSHGHRKNVDLNGGRADASEHSENPVGGGGSAFLKEVGEVLTNLNLEPRSCSQKAVCVLGQRFMGNLPGLLDVIPRIDLLQQTIGANDILNAIQTGSCEDAYSSCSSLSSEIFSYAPWLLQLFSTG